MTPLERRLFSERSLDKISVRERNWLILVASGMNATKACEQVGYHKNNRHNLLRRAVLRQMTGEDAKRALRAL